MKTTKTTKTTKPTKSAGANFRVLKNDSEMRRFVDRDQKTAPKMQPINITLRGPELSMSEKKRLEAQIQKIVNAEFEQAQRRIRLEQERHRRHDQGAITVSLKGLPLPDQDVKLVESKVEQAIAKILPEELRKGELEVCGCDPIFFPGWCYPGGDNVRLDIVGMGLPWPPPWPPKGFYLLAVRLKEDTMLWILEDGASRNLTSDQVLIGLKSRTGWAKEIASWRQCSGEGVRVHQPRASDTPVTMLLTKDQTDTIVFKKPKFFGVWTGMYHIEPTQFWPMLGGKIVTVDWLRD